MEDAAKYFADPAQWNSLDRQACALATGRVLDIGCGPGRHALVLQQAGHEVVAVDVSPGAVAGSPWIPRKVTHDGSSYLVELHLNPNLM